MWKAPVCGWDFAAEMDFDTMILSSQARFLALWYVIISFSLVEYFWLPFH